MILIIIPVKDGMKLVSAYLQMLYAMSVQKKFNNLILGPLVT